MAARDIFTGFKKLDFRPSNGPATTYKTVTRQGDFTKSKLGSPVPKVALKTTATTASPVAKPVTNETAPATPKPKPQPQAAAKSVATKMLMGTLAPKKEAPKSMGPGGVTGTLMRALTPGTKTPTKAMGPGGVTGTLTRALTPGVAKGAAFARKK